MFANFYKYFIQVFSKIDKSSILILKISVLNFAIILKLLSNMVDKMNSILNIVINKKPSYLFHVSKTHYSNFY